MNQIKLDIPYRSQWDVPDADLAAGDCGPTCVAMLLNGLGKMATPDDLYYAIYPELKTNSAMQIPNMGYTNFSHLFKAAQAYGMSLERFTYAPAGALSSLKASLAAGKPSIALVKYTTWRTKTGNNFNGAHFVVVSGCDDDHVLVHDPLFGPAYKTRRAKGIYYEWTNDEFKTAWGGFSLAENPNYACLTSETAFPFVEGGKGKEDKIEKEDHPVVIVDPVKPDDHIPPLAAIKRRIIALAAFEAVPAPNLDDPTSLNYWAYHVGKWGEEIAVHTVKSGDSLWNIAAQYYGQGSKWRAIMVFNELSNSMIAVGQRLEIPLPGRLDVGEAFDPTRPASDEQDGTVPRLTPGEQGPHSVG